MNGRKPCDFCLTCGRVPCEPRSGVEPTPAPTPVPAPVVPTPTPPTPAPVPPTPAPPIVPSPIPAPPSSGGVGAWLTQDLWDTIFPYADCSAVYSPKDWKPFYTRDYFVQAIDWMNAHINDKFHGFGSSSTDPNINKLEIAAFLANVNQEVGDPSLTAPYPWLYPPADPQTGPQVGPAGGCVALIEGIAPQTIVHDKNTPCPIKGILSVTLNNMRPLCRQVLGFRENDVISCIVTDVKNANQPNFGLGAGTGAGVVFQPGLVGVSDDGTLYGDEPASTKDVVIPTSKLVASKTDRKYACLGPYCQCGGKNFFQLSYSFNMSWCSIDLFGDYRLVRYPNLLVTADRDTWNNLPETFGFPGPNPGGQNTLPADIASTTPPAQILGCASAIWFWMTLRSGRPISCHQCMLEPKKYGITGVNLIVNNQSGLEEGSWAADKITYYKRICAIMGISWEGTIVSPPGIQ